MSLDEDIQLDKNRRNHVEVIIDRLVSPDRLARVTDSVEQALKVGNGRLIVAFLDETDDILMNEFNIAPTVI